MKLKSVIVKGPINKTLSYKLCQADPSIKVGVWEVAVASVCFFFTAETSHIVTLTTNYVQSQEVSDKGENVIAPTVLTVVDCFGTKNTKKIIGQQNLFFFEISNVYDKLELEFKDVQTGQTISGADAVVYLLYRQIA